MITQAHHGLCVADIAAARVALASAGFTRVQPNAPHPLVYVDEPGDSVGQRTCPDLGSPYRTHFVENPLTRHQIDLIEIDTDALEPRSSAEPMSGDLTVVMPVDVDPIEVADTLRPFFGDRLVVTADGEPWATVHVASSEWRAVQSFLVDVLGVPVHPLDEGRWALEGVGGRVEVDVSSLTSLPPPGLGKRYEGANHLRLLHRDLAAIDAAIAGRDDVAWILEPHRGFAFVRGPGGLTIEMFDQVVTR